MSAPVLYDGAVATNATKKPFVLTHRDFAANTLPALKSRGLGASDSIIIWEWVNGDWNNTLVTLTNAANETSKTISTPGKYATTLVMATAGPVHCTLESVTRPSA